MALRDRDLDRPLPLLPETTAAIKLFLGRHHSRHGDLQAVGSRDPALATTLFRLLGELRPAVTEEVSDLAHALSLIGRQALGRHIAKQPVLQPGAHGAKALRTHYSLAAHAAYFGRALADARGLPGREQIALVAQLANPAPLVLAAVDPESAMRAANAVRDGVPWATAYGAELQRDLNQLNATIGERWSLPQAVIRTARGDSPGATGLRIARSAAYLGLHATLGWGDLGIGGATTDLAEVLGLDPDGVRALVHQTAASAGRDLAAMNYPIAAFELVLLDGEVELEAAEQTKLDRVLRRMAQSPSDQPASDPTSELQTAVLRSLEEIICVEGLQRSAFFLLSEDRQRLRVRLTAGARDRDPLLGLELSVTRRHLFERLLSKAQSLWFNPETAAKYRQMLPQAISSLLEDREFFAMSLVVDKRPLGILFADGRRLSETGYRRFRRLCQGVAKTLSNRSSAV